MRTLKEEIAYLRQNGFHHNTVELSTLLAWFGEQVVIEDEARRLRDEAAKWRALAEANAQVAEACQRRHERSERLGL